MTCADVIDESGYLVPEPDHDRRRGRLALEARHADVNDKVEFYSRIASIQHYLVIEQEQRRVVYHGRGLGDDVEPRILRQGNIDLDPPGLALALVDTSRRPSPSRQ